MQKTLLDLQKNNPDLKAAQIIGLLNFLNDAKTLSINSLCTLSGLSKEVLKVFKSSISKFLIPSLDENLTINDLFNNEVLPLLKEYSDDFEFTLLDYSNDALLQSVTKLRNDYKCATKREYDQFFCTPQTTVNKVMALQKKDQIYNKNIAIIGDDDLVSISIALLNNKYNQITVFEIDDDLINFLTAKALELKLHNFEVVKYDAAKDIDPKYLKLFDVVVFDPPYTLSGLNLFLYRGLSLLKKFNNFSGSYIYIYICDYLKAPEKSFKYLQLFNESGLFLEDKINNYARYSGAETVGNTSSLYILKNTPFTKPVFKFIADTIYTNNSIKEEKTPFVEHLVFKISGVSSKTLDSKNHLNAAFVNFCSIHGLNIVNTHVTKFKPFGYTLNFILSNSNLTVHTWPEYGFLHLDLITCKPIKNKESMLKNLQKLFATNRIERITIE